MTQIKETIIKLQAGFEITTPKAHYTVVSLLGNGGFGAVHLVKTDEGSRLAMKVERKLEGNEFPNLTMEVAILRLVDHKKHFTNLKDYGQMGKDGFFFIAMDLCLEGVEELHKNGFIHRDLKPSNYACGLDDKKHIIYLLDFGLARKFTNDDCVIKEPRKGLPFEGTVRFASLSSHCGIEQGPKDDCESWFYLLLDLILPGGLPWNGVEARKQVTKWKNDCRQDERAQLFRGLKHVDELNKIYVYIVSRQSYQFIDYKFIYKLLAQVTNRLFHSSTQSFLVGMQFGWVEISAPYDWENPKEKTSKESSRSK